MNANSDLQGLGVSARNSDAADLAFSQSFTGNGVLPASASLTNLSATDAVPSTKTNTNSLKVTSSASSSLTWDANGNMTSDGTNTYKWDAENRLIEIDYVGINNYSQFSYDGLWRNTKIVETVSGSVTSTKQFIWANKQRLEERDGSGTTSSKLFARGQMISSSAYFFTKDHLRSVREMTNSSAVIQAEYLYDPFGRESKIQGGLEADFQYSGYYAHQRSGLCLARRRAYSAEQGRFISRDPIEERGGNNLFAYVKNQTPRFSDPSGLQYKQGHAEENNVIPGPGESFDLPPNMKDSGDPGAGTQDGGGSDGGGSGPPKPPCVPWSNCDGKPKREYRSEIDVNDKSCKEGDGGSCCHDMSDDTWYDPCGNKICGTGPAPPPPPTPQA